MEKDIEKVVINNEIHYSKSLSPDEIEKMQKINEQLKKIFENREDLQNLKK